MHPHGLYIDGAQTALPGLRMIVDTGHASTIAMLEDEKIAERIPSGSLLLVLKTAPKIEHLAAERGWVLVAPSSALNRRFENKLTIASEFLAVGLPSIEHIIVAPVETSWAVLAGRFGERIVVQEARGHAGEGTRLLTSLADFALLKEIQSISLRRDVDSERGRGRSGRACIASLSPASQSRRFFGLLRQRL